MQNKQIYIDFILKELNKGNVKYNDVCLLFCIKFDLTKQSFNKYWKIANAEHTEQRETINNAKLTATIEQEKEAVKMGLKSKQDRLFDLQKQCERLELKLSENITDCHTFEKGKLITGTRPLNILEIAKLELSLKEVRSEISKIEGDYSATKTETEIKLNKTARIIIGD